MSLTTITSTDELQLHQWLPDSRIMDAAVLPEQSGLRHYVFLASVSAEEGSDMLFSDPAWSAYI